MSTRGAIARMTDQGWEGRYHHFDSYPTGLGRTLWSILRDQYAGDPEPMLRFLLDEHSGWSNINSVDWSQPAGYGSPGPQCYCHGQRSEKGSVIFESADGCSESCDPLFIEWAYAFDVKRRQLYIFDARPVEGGPEGYGHHLLGVFPLDGTEPDWTALENDYEPAAAGEATPMR